MKHATAIACVTVCVFVLSPMPLAADEVPMVGSGSARSVIEDNVARDLTGHLGLNMAAGDSNAQNNSTSIVMGEARGRGVAQTSLTQSIDARNAVMPGMANAEIRSNAFSNARGALGINQASGVANAQSNMVAIGIGSEISLDSELAQSVAGPIHGPVVDGASTRQATVSDTAFSGARGIVQLNQSAGAGNATSNSFSMRMQME